MTFANLTLIAIGENKLRSYRICPENEWTKTFNIEYRPGSQQMIKFEIYDSGSSRQTLRKQDFMGSVETTVQNIAESRNYVSPVKMMTHGSKAKISVNATLLKTVHMQISGINLKDLDSYSKSDPFFAIKYKVLLQYYCTFQIDLQ